jgi:hypothetical protein
MKRRGQAVYTQIVQIMKLRKVNHKTEVAKYDMVKSNATQLLIGLAQEVGCLLRLSGYELSNKGAPCKSS